MTTKPIDTDRLIGNPIIADRLKSYFASYEKPDIIKALEEIGGWHEARDGRKVFRFENEIDNPILEDLNHNSMSKMLERKGLTCVHWVRRR